MDAIKFLEAEHRGAKKAMEAVKGARGAEKKRLFMALKAELEGHDRIEEQIFYAAVDALPKASDVVEVDKEAHLSVEKSLLKLSLLPVDEAEWDADFASMQAALLDHIQDEETRIFIKVRELLGNSEINALGQRMADAKSAAVNPVKA